MSKRRSAAPPSRRGRTLRPRASQRGTEIDAKETPSTSVEDLAWDEKERASSAPPEVQPAKPSPPKEPEVAEKAAESAPKVEAKPVEPAVEEKPVEPAVEEKSVEPAVEEKPVEPAVEEPKVETKTETKAKGKAKTDEVKVEEASTDSGPGSEKSSTSPSSRGKKAKGEAEEAAPRSKREGHEGSIESGEFSSFFDKAADGHLSASSPQHGAVRHDEHDHHDDAEHELPPQTIARRARFRRIVAAVVVVFGLISVVVLAKTFTSKPAITPITTASGSAPVAPPLVPSATPSAEVAPSAPVAPTAAASESAAAEPSAAPSAEPAPSASAPVAETPPGGDIEAMKKEILGLLNRGKRKEAMELAQKAIAIDPSDAYPYLYLGSALQESGKWKDGVEAYSECVRHATKGPVYECRAMGGKK